MKKKENKEVEISFRYRISGPELEKIIKLFGLNGRAVGKIMGGFSKTWTTTSLYTKEIVPFIYVRLFLNYLDEQGFEEDLFFEELKKVREHEGT